MEKRKLRYAVFIGDGDSSSFKAVQDAQPYGPEFQVMKSDCVGHIQKMMGTSLRKLVTDKRDVEVVRGERKGVSGHGRITKVLMNKFQNYYGMAIRSNLGDLAGMRTAVSSILQHYGNNHSSCPKVPDGWCKSEEPGYKSKDDIIAVMQPIFDRLSSDEILERVQRGDTQNRNESLHAKIWKRSPKHMFSSATAVRTSVALSIIQQKIGNTGLVLVLEELGIEDTGVSMQMLSTIDDIRIADVARHTTPEFKERRKQLRRRRKAEEDKAAETEPVTYLSGEFGLPAELSTVSPTCPPKSSRKRKKKVVSDSGAREVPDALDRLESGTTRSMKRKKTTGRPRGKHCEDEWLP